MTLWEKSPSSMETLTFDIETIPQTSSYSDVQQKELDKRVVRHMSVKNLTTKEDKIKTESMIAATNPFLGEIVCIGLMRTNMKGQYDTLSLIGNEDDILKRFWEILGKFTGLFITYNGLNFDIPYILKRSMIHKLVPTNPSFLDTRRFSKYPHFDVQQIAADFNYMNYISLEFLCESLGIQSPKEGEVKAENVAQAFKDGKIDEIAKYCIRDVEATYKSYSVIKNYTHKPFIRKPFNQKKK
jgi:predicted PolB exonuclease-like 3'-5' exonuclease